MVRRVSLYIPSLWAWHIHNPQNIHPNAPSAASVLATAKGSEYGWRTPHKLQKNGKVVTRMVLSEKRAHHEELSLLNNDKSTIPTQEIL